MERLLHAAEQTAAFIVADIGRRHAVNEHLAALRLIKTEQKLEDGTLAGAGAAGQRDLVAVHDFKAQVIQHHALIVAERDIAELDKRHAFTSCGDGLRLMCRYGIGIFFQREELVDAVDARQRGLDGLNLHAKAFNRREDLRNVVDNGNSRTGGHTEQRQHGGVAGSGKQHDDGDDHRVRNEDNGGVDGIIEVRLFHSTVALVDVRVIALFHVLLFAEAVNGADVVQCFRHMARSAAHGLAVFNLRCQHIFLHVAREAEQERQQNGQYDCQTAVLEPDNDQNTDDSARIGEHTDDAGGE